MDWRPGLAGHARVLAGTMPRTAVVTPRALTLQVAVTPPVARKYGLQLGSVARLSPAQGGRRAFSLRVTAIVAALGPAAWYWQADPLALAPDLERQDRQWFGAVPGSRKPGEGPATATGRPGRR